ncbi:MAG: 4-hydroxy-tetrahydrodipicolinate reductase [Chloroflexota bacterium]|nr:4-hydroxy-tetrahydrodipicolinate reductase [Chloroflexota bacterium]
MGREIVSAAAQMPDVTIVGGLIRPGGANDDVRRHETAGTAVRTATLADDRSLLAAADVLIDFTTPAGTSAYARACTETGIAFVTGTTGLAASHLDELQAAAVKVSVFYARNMSLGIAALLAVLPTIAAALPGFDIEIVETHHRHKADAPSGTALALAEAIAGALGIDVEDRARFGRHGIARRHRGEIGIHAVRGGGNPGEHQIIFASDGEEIRLSHRSFSRRAYAEGALRAASFVAGRAPNLYGVRDLLQAT